MRQTGLEVELVGDCSVSLAHSADPKIVPCQI